jgi:hypothetical protein
LEKYLAGRKDAEIRADIQQLAQASFEQARQAAVQVAQEVASSAASPDDLINLELYLAQIPAAVRRSQNRPGDPTGTPATFALRTPDDVLKVLPPKSVRFRPGDPLPGRTGWTLTEPLGVGGFGEVWLARHPQFTTIGRAVKFCNDLKARDRDLLHNGRVIELVQAQGNQPHIVPLVDVHLDGDAPWLMFEYVPGGDLGDVIHEWQTLSKSERVMRAVTALQELAAPVGHRSPMGTSVAARLAVHRARGEVAVGETIAIESILGRHSVFEGRVAEETRFGPYPAIIPEVSGRAFLTRRHEFILDPDYPLGAVLLP